MSSDRVVALGLVLLFVASTAVARPFGGRGLEFTVNGGWTNFDHEIRFDDDVHVSATLLAEVLPFASLGVELGRVGAYDRQQDVYQDVVLANLRARIEPWREARWNGGMLLGVTFMGFENRPGLDSVSEGFELGGGARWNIDADWRVRFDAILRLQTVNRPTLDEQGRPTGESEEIGFVWSQLLRIGVGRGF